MSHAERPRILLAGTSEAIDALTATLQQQAEILPALSVGEALGLFHSSIDVVACNVRFDESRMFDFLLALRQEPCGGRVRVVSFRLEGAILSPRMRNSIQGALEALGVDAFVDVPQISAEYGRDVALETLRQVILRGRI